MTRSGTNQLHGSLYEFLRNSDLEARDFFQAGSIEPFHRNQFGGAIGGAIKKDKIFFFGNYEGFRQSLAIPTVNYVPNAAARQGLIPINGQLVNVGVSPLIAPYLPLYAQPNGKDNGDRDAVWNYNFTPTNPAKNCYMERVDFHLSDKDNVYARYIFDPSNRTRSFRVADHIGPHSIKLGTIFRKLARRTSFRRPPSTTSVSPSAARRMPFWTVNPAIANLIAPAVASVPGHHGHGTCGEYAERTRNIWRKHRAADQE